MKVAVSISESDRAEDLGHRAENVNRLLVRLAEMLLGEGACLVLGHNWRRDGVMEAVHRAAIQYRGATPPIINLLPWPDVPGLSKPERLEAERTIQIVSVGLPDELEPFAVGVLDAERRVWLRARALTHMRRKLTKTADALICLGGRTSSFAGRYPGVVEEVMLMTGAQRPVYLFELLGGAAADMIRVIRREPNVEEAISRITHCNPETEVIYHRYSSGDDDSIINTDGVRRYFTETLSLDSLAAGSGFNLQEYDELCRSMGFQQVLAGVLRGLSEVWRTRQNSSQ